MRKQVLRTSAIALGVAAALPATAQEWNLKWGGFIHQHVAFGSSDHKTTVNVNDLSFTLTGDRRTDRSSGTPNAAQTYKTTVKIVNALPRGVNANYVIPLTAGLANAPLATQANIEAFEQLLITQVNLVDINGDTDAGVIGGDDSTTVVPDTLYLVVGTTGNKGNDGKVANVAYTSSNPTAVQTGFIPLHQKVADTNKAIDVSGNGQHSNTEVHFMPSITLDSGLTFGATIEFEGDKHGVDQSFVSVSSESLGTLKLGKHGKTGLGVGAPSVGLGINSGDHPNFIAVDAGSGAMSGTNTSIIGTADRISYTTPKNSLGGFEFGISYAPGGDTENGRTSGFLTKEEEADDLSDNIDVSLKFAQPFGDASFALGMRYGTAKEEGSTKNPRNFGIGAEIGFGNFTFGGSYADVEREALADSSSGWNLGASYNMEAWTFGIETYQGEADDGDEHSVSKIAASRTLGPGVVWDIYAVTAESTNTNSSLTVGAKDQKPGELGSAGIKLDSLGKIKASGNAFGTSIKLTF